ncbi:MAG: two-component regulator propeller domain-containing protein [Melioribacteraceae bacterium]|nr:two-component regulator propeller domain-containing protein [Melioribacteraceae bacterium]
MNPTSISSNFATSIYRDGEYLWIGTFNGLNRFDTRTKKFKRFFVDEIGSGFRVNYNILEIDKFPGYLWFGTNGNGLVKFNKNDFTSKQYTYDPEIDNGLDNRANFVRYAWYSDKRPNEIWMGTTNGINILNLDNETFRSYTHNPKDSTSISHPMLCSS